MIDVRKNIVIFLNEQFSKNEVRQIDLANYLGVPKSNVYHWTKGLNSPDINYIPRIAQFFGVSALQLMGLDNLEEITVEERTIIESYRNSSPEAKGIIKRILDIK
ncbi:MAG: helix-turn-helix domain-containing protein [Clostridia bacterium]|nr:helix-turn-helix domain-containing protein [Clostridia bacterium]